MFDAQGNVRGPYKGIYAELAPSDASELKAAPMRWTAHS
ncbi:UDP-N-acetylmuramate dehydrogenase domain protein [Mycobacterium ulcerans str. Harvey]|uniref:UDP-N-acetylmuramate dehydrogenase domain protein n=1 Tax=Mycobacterium ulcerans str. Harvey TaxID=1299332 RepID=A0ABN0QSP2_MYCUL|nr:UDP-N-acetylmuramate dehydrogenase domain protein [Mycobacterium ulcerans str. Harvey]